MESALDFIDFMEREKQTRSDAFDTYIRFLRMKKENWAFQYLYQMYLKQNDLNLDEEHLQLCQFLAFEYYDDIAAGTYEFNVYENMKNNAFYGA
jgi:hypothetical protein